MSKQSFLWDIVDSAVKELESNNDIKLSTNRDYVIGAIVKKIIEDEKITELSLRSVFLLA